MLNVPSDKLSDPKCSKIKNLTIPRCSFYNRYQLQRYWKGHTIAPS